MAIWDPPTEIGLLLYPDVASATVHGLTDLFTVASTLARQRIGANAPMLASVTGNQIRRTKPLNALSTPTRSLPVLRRQLLFQEASKANPHKMFVSA
jgi:hypothetical protein